MPPRPLQGLTFNSSTFFECDGISYAGLKNNTTGTNEAYNYKLNTFRLNFKTVGGHKVGDDLWLIGNSGNAGGGEAFDIILKDDKGGKITDKAAIEAADKKWTMDLMPVAIMTAGIDSFEVLATIANDLNVILVDQNIDAQQFHLFSLEEKKEALEKLSELVALWLGSYEVNSEKPWEDPANSDKILELGEWLGNRGLFYVPICAMDDPRLEAIAVNVGSRMKAVYKFPLPPLNSEEICPHTGIKITLPEVKKKGSWGVASSETTAQKIAAREAHIYKVMGVSDFAGLCDLVANPKDKISRENFEILLKVIGS